jgi:hypothetical protein
MAELQCNIYDYMIFKLELATPKICRLEKNVFRIKWNRLSVIRI